MKKNILLVCLTLVLFSGSLFAQAVKGRDLVDSLTTIDPEIRKYFPRWRICETDLQIQIYQAFRILGFDERKLSKTKTEILAAPKTDTYAPYDLLLLTCGEVSLNATQMTRDLGEKLVNIISGAEPFSNPYTWIDGQRDYCFVEIPPEIPVTTSQAQAIVSFLEPTNVTHSFTISFFEQTLKFGETGFWLKNQLGTDELGYIFWSSGASKILLRRPLYANMDSKTTDRIPYLINAYLGGAYRITSGINNNSTFLRWVPSQMLNEGPGGRILAGLDFFLPFHPQLGIHLNAEIPLRELKDEPIDPDKYYSFKKLNELYGDSFTVVPILRSSGQVTLFYNLWITEVNPENYFRLDLGINYFEIRELVSQPTPFMHRILTSTVEEGQNLETYKPNEFADWIYAKLEYRNQSTWPFGASIQYSNQILLGQVYVPLFNWLYIEAKIARILRTPTPFENKTFFMISPVLRLAL